MEKTQERKDWDQTISTLATEAGLKKAPRGKYTKMFESGKSPESALIMSTVSAVKGPRVFHEEDFQPPDRPKRKRNKKKFEDKALNYDKILKEAVEESKTFGVKLIKLIGGKWKLKRRKELFKSLESLVTRHVNDHVEG